MRKLLLTIAASTLMVSGAIAADPIITVEPAYIPQSYSFDWDGFYAGLGVTGIMPSAGTNFGSLDLIAGANFTNGDMLFGLEGWGNYTGDGVTTAWGGGLEARIGYLATPEALLYASAGGQFYDTGVSYGTLGGGVEFAVTDDLSLDLEYKYWLRSGSTTTAHSIGVSALWHF